MASSETTAIVTAVAVAYLVGLLQGQRVGSGRASRRYARVISRRGGHSGHAAVLIGALVAAAYLYVH
jgi:hypothetical protein